MRHLLGPLAALCLLPAAAHAGGAPGSMVATAAPSAVCYPESRFELCPVPPVTGHTAGYLPRTVPARVFVGGQGARFAILVSPNVVPYRDALAEAEAAALAYCGQAPGERAVARIDSRARYADEDLASWRFAGRCE